ncbi:MAG: SDR family NAD(P)-dependent oxidoreductase, partial [Acidimicrobiales bacterium]
MSQPVAIVTGAGRGIGAATVAALVADGWWVAAVDRCSPHPAIGYPMASSDDLADVVTAADGNAAAFEADVSVGAEMAEVVASVTDARGRLDAVVCAAGVVAGGSPAWEIDDSEWDAVIGTDLTGVFTTTRAAVPALLAAPHGRIL